MSAKKPKPHEAGPATHSWHPFLGAHMSIAGGLHRALEEAARLRCGAVQLFTKSANQWAAKPLTGDAIRKFRETDAALGPFQTAAHDSYLINLGSPDPTLYKRSVDAFTEEIERCEALSIPRLVFHPGSHMGAGEAAGLKRMAEAVRDSLRRTAGFRTRLLVENTAGQGTNLGHRIEHLAELLERIGEPGRTGVCIDTCHLFAAGYDFRTIDAFAALREELDTRIGLERIQWFHLNDCRADLGKRVDRHAHIGKGCIGSKPFAFFLKDPLFRQVPMILETPKEDGMDSRNLAHLRGLSRIPVGSGPRRKRAAEDTEKG